MDGWMDDDTFGWMKNSVRISIVAMHLSYLKKELELKCSSRGLASLELEFVT